MGFFARLWRALAGPRARRTAPVADDPGDDALGEDAATGADGIAVVPIEAELDLHHFSPRDLPSVVDEYVRAAHAKGLREVTLIHGRGKGVARARVARVLERHPLVLRFAPAGGARALGATVAWLTPGRRGGSGPGAGRASSGGGRGDGGGVLSYDEDTPALPPKPPPSAAT